MAYSVRKVDWLSAAAPVAPVSGFVDDPLRTLADVSQKPVTLPLIVRWGKIVEILWL
jgi:hypothetical protein